MNEIIMNVVTEVTIALIGLASAYALVLIKKGINKALAETKKIQDDRQRDLVNTALHTLDALTEKTVTSIEQTTAKEIRVAVKDGKVDRQELLDLSERAYDEITGQLKGDYKKALEETFLDLDKYIMDTIESQVLKVKTQV